MEVSKLTFTKKTQDEIKKGMTARKKGKVLFARLKELEEDGTLSKAQTKADVARMVGYPEERAAAGYMWVSGLIKRGYLREIIQGWKPGEGMVAEYHTTGSMPDYDYDGRKKQKHEEQTIAKVAEDTTEREEVVVHTPDHDYGKVITNTPIKIEIAKGDMTIKVEFAEAEQATNLITTIMKGE